VKDHCDAVAGQLHVNFDAIAMFDRGFDGGQAVFHSTMCLVVIGAVGQRARQKGLRQHQAISNTASISTMTPSGKLATPTAERA
jgi:hypothetical protein